MGNCADGYPQTELYVVMPDGKHIKFDGLSDAEIAMPPLKAVLTIHDKPRSEEDQIAVDALKAIFDNL